MRTRCSAGTPAHWPMCLVLWVWRLRRRVTRDLRAYSGALTACLAVAFSPIAALAAATPAQLYLAFNPAPVGIAAASAQMLTASFTVTGSDTPTAQLHYGSDYTAGAVNCASSAGGQTCTVPVTFTPTLPGARKDALFLMDGTTILAMVYLSGVGQSPQALVQPGMVTQLVSGATYEQGESAVDENGTVYVLSHNSPPGSNVHSVTKAGVVSVVPVTVNSPTGIAIDGAGILYITQDFMPGSALITWNTVTQTQGMVAIALPPPYPCHGNEYLTGVAVDAVGVLYTLDLNCQSVIHFSPNGSYVVNVIDPAMNANPSWIVVDSNGNVFFSCGDIINEQLANGNQTAVTNPGDPEGRGLAVDPAGSLYVIPGTFSQGISELPASNYQASQALFDPTSTVLGLGLGSDGTLYAGTLTTLDKVDRSQGAVAFGEQTVGTASAAQSAGIYNGGNEPLTISGIALTGASSGFAIQPAAVDNCAEGLQMASGEYCQVTVTLTPTHAGTLTASITFTTNSLNSPAATATVALSGSASGPYATLSPNPVAFGDQAVTTTSAPATVALTNSGNQPLTGVVITLTSTNPSDFAINTGTNACGNSLPAGSSCSIYVTFTPAAAASYSAMLSVADNASGSPQTAELTGTGTSSVSAVNININEAVHLDDAPKLASAVAIQISEAVHITDMPLLNAPLDLNIAEIIHTTDTPMLAPTTALNITEVVHTTDAPMLVPTAALNIAEIIHTTDAPVPEPTLDLNIAEVIHTTDVFADKILTTPTETVLSSSGNPSLAGQTVTFTATVSPTSAAVGTPAGSVQFSINGTAAGAPALLDANGRATYTTAALADGSSSITAVYNGSSGFLSSNAAAFTQLVLDFGFITGSTQSATIFPGQSASFEFSIDSKGTFGGTITFSASGLPPGATASFNPASLTPGGTASNVVMTVQTAALSAAAPAWSWSTKSPLLLGLLLPLFAIRPLRRARNRDTLLFTVAVSLGIALAIAGCGGSGFFAHAPNTYPITVTATNGPLQHAVTVNLTVQ
jgi:hypothetical protein